MHVQHWIKWAIDQFHLEKVHPHQWASIDGPALCQMTHQEFTEKVPCDSHDMFWTHLELLRKCKFVGNYNPIHLLEYATKMCYVTGVIQKPVPYLQYVTTPLNIKGDVKPVRPKMQPSKATAQQEIAAPSTAGNRTGKDVCY